MGSFVALFLGVFFMLLMELNCDNNECSRMEECYKNVLNYRVDGRKVLDLDLTRQSVYDEVCSLLNNSKLCYENKDNVTCGGSSINFYLNRLTKQCSPAERYRYTDSCNKITGCQERLHSYEVDERYFTVWDLVQQQEVYDYYCQMVSNGSQCVEAEKPNCNRTAAIEDAIRQINKWEFICSAKMKPILEAMTSSKCYGNYSVQEDVDITIWLQCLDQYNYRLIEHSDSPNEQICEFLYEYRECTYNMSKQYCGESYAYIMRIFKELNLRQQLEANKCTNVSGVYSTINYTVDDGSDEDDNTIDNNINVDDNAYANDNPETNDTSTANDDSGADSS